MPQPTTTDTNASASATQLLAPPAPDQAKNGWTTPLAAASASTDLLSLVTSTLSTLMKVYVPANARPKSALKAKSKTHLLVPANAKLSSVLPV